MKLIYRFKIYINIVCDDKKTLYQLEHFHNKRTHPFKKLTYNSNRKAYRIKSQWVSKRRLYKLMYRVDENIKEPLNILDKVLNELSTIKQTI